MKYEPFVRSPYNYDVDEASDLSGLSCGEPTRTQQNFKDECDINVIMERFGKTGQLPANMRTPSFEDYSSVTDFHSAMNAIRSASEDFMRMPAHIRARFDNDPQLYLEFFADNRNRDEAKKLGLIMPDPVEPSPVKVKVIPDENPGGPQTPT